MLMIRTRMMMSSTIMMRQHCFGPTNDHLLHHITVKSVKYQQGYLESSRLVKRMVLYSHTAEMMRKKKATDRRPRSSRQ